MGTNPHWHLVCRWTAVLAGVTHVFERPLLSAEMSSCGDTLSASYDVAAVQAYPAPFCALAWLSRLLFGFFVVSPARRAAACCPGGTPAAAVEGLAWMWKKEALLATNAANTNPGMHTWVCLCIPGTCTRVPLYNCNHYYSRYDDFL